jgi:hypothetical protein
MIDSRSTSPGVQSGGTARGQTSTGTPASAASLCRRTGTGQSSRPIAVAHIWLRGHGDHAMPLAAPSRPRPPTAWRRAIIGWPQRSSRRRPSDTVTARNAAFDP